MSWLAAACVTLFSAALLLGGSEAAPCNGQNTTTTPEATTTTPSSICVHEDGHIFQVGEMYVKTPCVMTYYCESPGQYFPLAEECFGVDCVDPVKRPGDCCMSCPNGRNCNIDGKVVPAGVNVTTSSGLNCWCWHRGSMMGDNQNYDVMCDPPPDGCMVNGHFIRSGDKVDNPDGSQCWCTGYELLSCSPATTPPPSCDLDGQILLAGQAGRDRQGVDCYCGYDGDLVCLTTPEAPTTTPTLSVCYYDGQTVLPGGYLLLPDGSLCHCHENLYLECATTPETPTTTSAPVCYFNGQEVPLGKYLFLPGGSVCYCDEFIQLQCASPPPTTTTITEAPRVPPPTPATSCVVDDIVLPVGETVTLNNGSECRCGYNPFPALTVFCEVPVQCVIDGNIVYGFQSYTRANGDICICYPGFDNVGYICENPKYFTSFDTPATPPEFCTVQGSFIMKGETFTDDEGRNCECVSYENVLCMDE